MINRSCRHATRIASWLAVALSVWSASAVALDLTLTFSTGDIAVAIPDNDVVSVPISVPDIGTVAGVKVSFRINHTFDSDLVISLVHPDGTVVNLVKFEGAGGDNFGTGVNDCSGTPTVIDDNAATVISAGFAPFNDAFIPEEPLATVVGKQAEGTWKLRVSDTAMSDTGTIGCVKLELKKVAGAGREIHAWAPVAVTAENAVPANGVPDPGETLTVNFPLIDLGDTATTNLVATLLATGGVTNPSGAQAYGALAVGGPAVTRPFTFTAAGTCGNAITATFALQDGVTNLGTVSFALLLGGTQLATPQAFANATPIAIPFDQVSANGVADPYPSSITVSGITGTLGALTVNLNAFSHTFPADVDLLLVSPTGRKMIIMSAAGSFAQVVDANLVVADSAATQVPDTIVSGSYRPSSFDFNPAFDPPAPTGPYLNAVPVGIDTLTTAFAGDSPNGTWSLYAFDTAPADSGSLGGGWGISITPQTPLCSVVGGQTGTLDIDLSSPNTKYDALTDGLLVIRYLFNLTGTPLTSGALGGTAARTDPAAIKAYLDSMRPALDIDGSGGDPDALTDGLLIIRYLFNLRGAALIANAVAPSATRKTAPEIEAYLQTLMP